MQARTPAPSGYAEVNGARLYYEIAGSGPPLVLLHEGICDSRMWDEQWELFARSYTVIRYDARGMGRSVMPPGPFMYHEDLHGLLTYLGVERAALVGVSMGGATALDAALAYPHMVDALVLVSSGIGGDEPPEVLREAWRAIDRLAESGDIAGANEIELRMWVDGPRRTPQQVDAVVRERVREMNANIFDMYSEEGEPQEPDRPAIGRLAEIAVPTLVIVGAEDQPHVLDSAKRLASGIAGAREVVIRDTAHVPSMERPDQFNRAVLGFLGGIYNR